jgi:hypothetical protein
VELVKVSLDHSGGKLKAVWEFKGKLSKLKGSYTLRLLTERGDATWVFDTQLDATKPKAMTVTGSDGKAAKVKLTAKVNGSTITATFPDKQIVEMGPGWKWNVVAVWGGDKLGQCPAGWDTLEYPETASETPSASPSASSSAPEIADSIRVTSLDDLEAKAKAAGVACKNPVHLSAEGIDTVSCGGGELMLVYLPSDSAATEIRDRLIADRKSGKGEITPTLLGQNWAATINSKVLKKLQKTLGGTYFE